ncbi:peptide ABC transporter [Falsiroseomonas bella]|uniref:Peptide ABC transporter n=1 Tax=Falsiroseomonas bella TaxID=2184016 RepID=A0A317FAL1_9PROT|nr:ABC transporter substrate-binding protein [Falsiroseomonas bella]PWS34518.1 peptide ABC transporter [Falsiroseomonas bella]
MSTAFGATRLGRRATLASLLAGGLVSGAAAQEARRGGTLRAVIDANPSSLDPHVGGQGGDHAVLSTLYDRLVDYDPATLAPRPSLATAWRFESPTQLVLELRQGVTFHDGETFDAAAVKANFAHMMTNPRSTVRADIASVAEVEVAAPHVVVLKLRQPDTTLPMIFTDRAGMMSSPKALAERGENYGRNPVGTGAMQFVRWTDAAEIVVQRNPRYWKPGEPLLDGIVMPIITDTTTGLRSVRAGQNHISLNADAQQIPGLRRASDVTVSVQDTFRLQQCYINFSKPPLNDIRLRQALNFAIDRVAYARVVLGGVGAPADLHVPKGLWAYDAEAASKYPYDPDRAKRLIAEAGFGPGQLTINASYASNQLNAQRIEILSAFLDRVGVKLTSTTGTLTATLQTWRDGVGDIRLANWTGRPDPALTYQLLLHPSSAFNIGRAVPSPELIEAIAASRTVESLDERRVAMARVLRLEREFALTLPLAFEPEITALSRRVRNYVTNLAGRPRFEQVWLAA